MLDLPVQRPANPSVRVARNMGPHRAVFQRNVSSESFSCTEWEEKGEGSEGREETVSFPFEPFKREDGRGDRASETGYTSPVRCLTLPSLRTPRSRARTPDAPVQAPPSTWRRGGDRRGTWRGRPRKA